MAVAGQRIAAVCEGDTVNVYDAVTGVLRLSLNAPRQVIKVEGSPDGSILFFAHQSACEITVLDTQTGGLVYTLTATFEISDIAVSLGGKYLASCSSDGTFEFWEVESRRGDSHFLGRAVECICWLEPEDQIALVFKGAVVILEVTTGRTLQTFPVRRSVRGIAFFADRCRLAILSAIGVIDRITVIDIRTGSVLVSSPPLTGVSCFTFSGGRDRVICATKTGDLRSFHISIPSFSWDDHLKRLETIHSISLLRSGQLVVNVGGSIQLLELEYAQSPGTSLDPEIFHGYQLDNGKALSVSSGDHAHLLDMETMRILTRYHPQLDKSGVSFRPRFICASIGRDIAVVCFRKLNRFTLKLRTITISKTDQTDHKWEKDSSQPAVLGALSPDGEKLVIVGGSEGPTGGGNWELCVRRVSDGKILASSFTPFVQKGRPPSNIAFTSDTQFYTEDHPVFSAPPWDENNCKDHRTRRTFFLKNVRSHLKIEAVTREEILPAPQPHPYELDDNLEWVVDAKLRRVCWLPPGYVSGAKKGLFLLALRLLWLDEMES